MSERRVMAWCTVSIDGYSSGPGGPGHDTWLYEHVMRPATSEYFEGIWRGCSTALMGRNNYAGFHSVWPGITGDPATDPRAPDPGPRPGSDRGRWQPGFAVEGGGDCFEGAEAVNAPHLVALVRGGARFERGVLIEREGATAA